MGCNGGSFLVEGDAREFLGALPAGSVQLVFTSPPYFNARSYTQFPSYADYLGFLAEVLRGVHRVLEDGRFLVLNLSPVLVPRARRSQSSVRLAIPFDVHPLAVKAGFDFVDDILWVKPAPAAKGRVFGFERHRRPLAYKPLPVTEYVLVYRKRCGKLVDWNIRRYPREVIEQSRVTGSYFQTNVWAIAPERDSVHPAVFPRRLAWEIVRLYSYTGDLVLDPFAGRGTVGLACWQLGRRFLLVESSNVFVRRAVQFLSAGGLREGVDYECITASDKRILYGGEER